MSGVISTVVHMWSMIRQETKRPGPTVILDPNKKLIKDIYIKHPMLLEFT